MLRKRRLGRMQGGAMETTESERTSAPAPMRRAVSSRRRSSTDMYSGFVSGLRNIVGVTRSVSKELQTPGSESRSTSRELDVSDGAGARPAAPMPMRRDAENRFTRRRRSKEFVKSLRGMVMGERDEAVDDHDEQEVERSSAPAPMRRAPRDTRRRMNSTDQLASFIGIGRSSRDAPSSEEYSESAAAYPVGR